MTEFDTILQAASRLAVDDRLRLIDELSSTVPDDQPPRLSSEWLKEIARRSAEIDAGTVVCEPWSDVRERVFGTLGIDRAN